MILRHGETAYLFPLLFLLTTVPGMLVCICYKLRRSYSTSKHSLSIFVALVYVRITVLLSNGIDVKILILVRSEFGWPAGTYGMPEPATGCPNFGDIAFKRGYTYHNTEDEHPANKRSQNYHFAGNFSQHGVQQRFCIKEESQSSPEIWPEGKYCLYKKGLHLI